MSLKTVSRVVNGEPGVSGDLAERVHRAAALLDYRPNLGASILRRGDGKTATIGLLLENVANPFSSALHRAVEDVARRRGVAVFAGSLDEDAERERSLAEAFAARRVDGLIIVPASRDHSYLVNELRVGTALVFVDRPPSLLGADAVLTDNLGGAAGAVEHLTRVGHRRIAYLGDLTAIVTAQERHAGFCDAMAAAHLPIFDGDDVDGLHTTDDAEAAVLAMFRGPAPPTALFTSQNLVTIGAIRALRQLGLQRQVALVGFDDFLLYDLLEPAVTVIAQDPAAMGSLAADLLFRRLDGDGGPPRTHVLPTRLIVRGSGEIRPPLVVPGRAG